MRFIQLNVGWNAQPNDPNVAIVVLDRSLSVTFYLNAFQYPEFEEGDIGILTFQDCIKYRRGAPSDEGFYIYGQSRYKNYGIKWGEFYLIEDSDWKENFPDAIRISGDVDSPINHYLFYFKDETFECIAGSYKFEVKSNN